MANRPPKTERVFFALWPDDALRGALHTLAQRWQAHCGGRVTRRENLHLTLVFIGNVDQQQLAVLSDLAARQIVQPFDFELGAGGYFKRNRIVSAQPAAAPAALREIVSGLEHALRASGVPFDARPHVPHVTLLRDAERAPVPLIELPLTWRVEASSLVRSQPGATGVTYEVIASSRRAIG